MKRFKMPETLSQQINDFEPLNSLVLSSDIFDKNLSIKLPLKNSKYIISQNDKKAINLNEFNSPFNYNNK